MRSPSNHNTHQLTSSGFATRQRTILWLACSAIFFEALDVSVVNLALPVIAGDLHVSIAAAQWVQTGYLLTFGGFLLLGGRLSDYAGSKRIFLLGMLLFAGASALALLSHHIIPLLTARAAQGMGAALAIPGAISLISRHFEEGRPRQTAMGIFGAFAAIGFAGGLALGGIITSFYDWHWIFGINVPVILPVLAAGCYLIPGEKMNNAAPLSPLTACWLTATLLLFCYCIHEWNTLGWSVLPLLAAAGISGFTLLRYDRHHPQPFFAKDIFAGSAGLRALGASLILGISFLSFIFLCTLSLFEVMHWSVQAIGLLMFPYSIGSALVAKFFLPWLYTRMKVSQVALLAMICLAAGLLLLLTGVEARQLSWYLAALFLVNSVCISIAYPSLTILSLSNVPSARQGIAAGLQSATYSMGSSIGLSLVGCCLQAAAADSSSTQISLTCLVIMTICSIAPMLLVKRQL
ncbi:MFS transporter [Flavitalea sp. BT771]|uniref:MFS transporter n=1 Tax=Flavitalea sp. BT771 TaxID=3063329 RepID=UPI0026E2271F|nr:MFS transporter [Flavitalea sp. BT771]MDO6435596.1 MFS transporter [Flavitalea sp. BT771]MDV6224496.1 MFS transporter [Flavitalea sp. BT771]